MFEAIYFTKRSAALRRADAANFKDARVRKKGAKECLAGE
jgi:hypothetical protein